MDLCELDLDLDLDLIEWEWILLDGLEGTWRGGDVRLFYRVGGFGILLEFWGLAGLEIILAI